MSWITTNIRLPEDVYMDLKMQAAKERKSIAALIRERIAHQSSEEGDQALLQELQNVSNKIAKASRNKSLSDILIKSRYEHL